MQPVATVRVLRLCLGFVGLGLTFLASSSEALFLLPSKCDLFEKCLQAQGVNTSELVTRPTTTTTTGATATGSGNGNTSSYSDLNHQWNNCCGYKAPVAYFVVQSVRDVQIGVRCARLAGVRIVPKSGGHSYGKFSFGNNETVVIDLQKLDQIKVDNSSSTATANIGPGALMGQVTYGLFNDGGYVIPFGACQVVGMAYGLGGGFSEISRLYGMNVDALVEMDMVDATGNLLTTNAIQNPDLFWALRGGGGGSYGIVTRFKYRLFTAPVNVVQGRQMYAFTEFVGVYNAWKAMLRSNPDDTVNAILRVLPSQANVLELTVNQFQFGTTPNTTEVQTLLAGFPSTTLGPATIRSMPYLNFVMEAGNEETGFNINITDPSQLPQLTRYDFNPSGTLYAKTFYAPRFIENADDMGRVFTKLSARPANIIIILRALGGQIAAVSPTATAFVHRGQNVYEEDVLYIGPASGVGAEQELATAKRWMNEYYELTRSIIQHKESFQNHLDVGLTNYLDRYYGENLNRLIRVKDIYDPGNVFYNPQSIPTSRLYQNGGLVQWSLF